MLTEIKKMQWNEQGSIFIIFIFLGTIAGILIDAMRHVIEDCILDRTLFKNEIDDMRELFFQEEYQIKAYAYFVDEQIFYYYEAWLCYLSSIYCNKAMNYQLTCLVYCKCHSFLEYE